jgi:signal transduction histidine kinase
VFPSLLSASVVNDSDGNLIGVMGVSHDATSRLEVERMKNEFVSTVSDELRTPLTSIVASLNLIAESPAGSVAKDLLPLVTIANENSERLMKLVNDILDMEKLEFHKMEFHIEDTDVLPLVERAIETMEPWARKLGVEIEMKVAGGSSRVDADPERLHQVLTNLLSNAIKFSPQNDHVQVSLSSSEERVRIEVTDHGPGIPEEFQPRIFERFARADGPSGRKRGGTGLGLRISKEIMERLGGKIGFHSEPGIRTTFHIELPELA